MCESMSPKNVVRLFVEISVGELFDRLVILEIKSQKVQNQLVEKELMSQLDDLRKKVQEQNLGSSELEKLVEKLKKCNEQLWLLEDRIRVLERRKKFDAEFVNIAREIYRYNDMRYSVKNEINQLTHSSNREYKFYS